MTGDDYDWQDDAIKSFEYAIHKMRERLVRSGQADPLPDNEQEQQWAREGERGHA